MTLAENDIGLKGTQHGVATDAFGPEPVRFSDAPAGLGAAER
jgi:hypothetical protein